MDLDIKRTKAFFFLRNNQFKSLWLKTMFMKGTKRPLTEEECDAVIKHMEKDGKLGKHG